MLWFRFSAYSHICFVEMKTFPIICTEVSWRVLWVYGLRKTSIIRTKCIYWCIGGQKAQGLCVFWQLQFIFVKDSTSCSCILSMPLLHLYYLLQSLLWQIAWHKATLRSKGGVWLKVWEDVVHHCGWTQQWEFEAAGHIVSTVRGQREKKREGGNPGAQVATCMFFLFNPRPHLWNKSTHYWMCFPLN